MDATVSVVKGKWHHIDAASINPLPVQRPIPVWFGGGSDALLRRTARMGDGWITVPQVQTGKRTRRCSIGFMASPTSLAETQIPSGLKDG